MTTAGYDHALGMQQQADDGRVDERASRALDEDAPAPGCGHLQGFLQRLVHREVVITYEVDDREPLGRVLELNSGVLNPRVFYEARPRRRHQDASRGAWPCAGPCSLTWLRPSRRAVRAAVMSEWRVPVQPHEHSGT